LYVLSTEYKDLCKDDSFPRIFGMNPSDKFVKLPYLKVTDAIIPSLDPDIIGNKSAENKQFSDNTTTTALVYDKQLNEYRVHTEQLGNDIKKYGRLRGNM